MAKVQFKQGILFDNLPAPTVDTVIARGYLKEQLVMICADLRDLAAEQGAELVDLKVSAAYLLLDFAQVIQLSKEEIDSALGHDLAGLGE